MRIAGVDEAGRGPLAGPVVAAAVVLPPEYRNEEITDSKQLSPKKRDELVAVIRAVALDWSVVAVGHHRIKAINIREASRLAMSLALKRVRADMVLVDGNVAIEAHIPQRTVVQGDALHIQISAASVIAKTFRDHLMTLIDKKYPGYDFTEHFGYPTEKHRHAIIQHGPCPVHRVTFRGVAEHLPTSKRFQQELVFESDAPTPIVVAIDNHEDVAPPSPPRP